MRCVQHADGEHIRRRHDSGRRLAEVHELVERLDAAGEVIGGVLDVLGPQRQAVLPQRGLVGLLALGDVAQPLGAGEGDVAVPQADEVVHDGTDAGPVVHAHGGDAAFARAMPQGHDRDPGALEVADEAGPVAQVTQEEKGVTMPRLKDAPQGDGFVGTLVGVPQHDVVAPPVGLQRGSLDGAGEEGVSDVPDDDAQAAWSAHLAGRGREDWDGSRAGQPSP